MEKNGCLYYSIKKKLYYVKKIIYLFLSYVHIEGAV